MISSTSGPQSAMFAVLLMMPDAVNRGWDSKGIQPTKTDEGASDHETVRKVQLDQDEMAVIYRL